jgi:hypothetical protein
MNTNYIANVFPVINSFSIDDGMLSLLVPYPVRGGQFVYTDRTADYFLNGVKMEDGSRTPLEWGNLNKDIYVDPVSKNMGDVTRQTFVVLSNQLLLKGDTAGAQRALKMHEEFFPKSNFPHDRFALMMVYAYSHVGDQVTAYDILCDVFDYYYQYYCYAKQFPDSMRQSVAKMLNDSYYFIYQVVLLRQREQMVRNPFDSISPERPLTAEGEKQFLAADPANAARLKAIDDFAASSMWNEVMAYMSNIR